MKKVDTNKVWRGKSKTEKLEMKGFSTPHSDKTSHKGDESDKSELQGSVATKQPRYRGTTMPRDHDTTTPRYQETIIEIIRKAVKEFGKEAATHRFTVSEKKAIADIIFRFKVKDIKTSENEIARIAVNFILQDYKENRSKSILERTLRALNE